MLSMTGCDEPATQPPYTTFELESPQLGLTKKIWLYLPESYHQSSASYPVIYFQDGQWLFEENVDYSAEMHVDETLRQLERDGGEGIIVVGIESDEETRADEFSLYENPDYAEGGKGGQYLAFVAETLKPYIDSHYRTKNDRSNTCIIGKAALFSAALHFNADAVLTKAAQKEVMSDVLIFGVVGKGEFNEVVNFPKDNQTLFNSLGRYIPASQLHLEVIEDGEHRIWFWDREFSKAIGFLF
jgi:predicted alpha/beta superfamily hydrolase